jgi:uncharacterized protein YggU (UPF0235/DUF167 family)
MKIWVKAKPGVKQAGIKKKERPEGLFSEQRAMGLALPELVVAVKERTVAGAANRAILKAVAAYFGVPLARVRIVSGRASREKLIEIEERPDLG